MENEVKNKGPQPEVSTPEVDSNAVKTNKSKWLIGLVIMGAVGYGGWYLGQNQKTNVKNQNDNAKVKNIETPTATKPTTQSSSTINEPPTTTVPDPTAGWKTYENTKYGYTVKYPSSYYLTDWLYDERTKIKVNTGDFVHIDKTRRDDDYYLANVGGRQAYFRIMSVNTESNELKLMVDGLSVSNTKVDDQNAFIHTTTKPSDYDGSYYSEIRLNYGGKFYSISWVNEDLNGNHDKTIDQILSTFKFTP